MSSKYCPYCEAEEEGALSEICLERLRQGQVSNIYPAGAELFRQSNPSYGVFWIKSGEVELEIDEQQSRLLRSGEILEGKACLDLEIHDFSARTLSKSQIIFLDKSFIKRFFEQHPQLNWQTLTCYLTH